MGLLSLAQRSVLVVTYIWHKSTVIMYSECLSYLNGVKQLRKIQTSLQERFSYNKTKHFHGQL